jgi:hypothetical protein
VVWADSRALEDPDGEVYIKQWMESMEYNGGGKPAVVATNYQSGYGKGNRKDGGTLDGKEFPIDNECNKTPSVIDLHSAAANTPTRQLFLENFSTPYRELTPALHAMEDDIALQDEEDKEKTARIDALCTGFEAAARQRLQASDKRISWSSPIEASINQGDVVGKPPHYARGTPHVASGKQEKLAARLATTKWDSAAANARVASLWANQGGPDGTLPAQGALPPNGPEDPIDGTSKNPIQESPSSQGPEDSSNSASASSATPATLSSTPKSRVSLSSLGAQMISDIALVRQDSCRARVPTPVLDGTNSLLNNGSVSATTTSSFSRRSSLNASNYPLVPHGQLPVNKCGDEHQVDMFSMDHWIDLGAKGHFWYLSVGIDYIEDEDSRGTMLLGMSSILETFPHMISGFELHPLNPASTLPFLTSNDVKRGFAQSALLMFKYFHIKNKINLQDAPQTTTVAATVSLTRFDDEAECMPSNTLGGTIKVQADENVKEAVEALT